MATLGVDATPFDDDDDDDDRHASVRRVMDLVSVDDDALTDPELTDGVLALNAHIARMEARRACLLARWDGRTVWAGDGARSAAAWLAAQGETSRQKAWWDVHVARSLRQMPATEAAYQDGRLHTAKVALLVKVRAKVEDIFAAHEAFLVEQLVELTVAEAGRFLAAWRRRALPDAGEGEAKAATEEMRLHLSPGFEGRWLLDGELDAESGAIVDGAIAAAVDEMFRRGQATADDGVTVARRRAEALVELVERGAKGTSTQGAPRPTVVVTVDHRTLAHQPVDGIEDLHTRMCDIAGVGSVALSTVERMACDCNLVRIVLGADSEVLDVGRDLRLPSRAMRRALRVRDKGCVFPGCDVEVDRCEAHHVVPWEWEGDTSLENLALLCRFHHHQVHEGGYVLVREPLGLIRVWRPDGTALPLSSHGQRLLDDETVALPGPDTTGAPPGVQARRQALRAPPPARPMPRFREPDDIRRRARHTAKRRAAAARQGDLHLVITFDDLHAGRVHARPTAMLDPGVLMRWPDTGEGNAREPGRPAA